MSCMSTFLADSVCVVGYFIIWQTHSIAFCRIFDRQLSKMYGMGRYPPGGGIHYKEQAENIMRAASLNWRTDKYSIVRCRYYVRVFYNAERILSFLFTFLGREEASWNGKGERYERMGREDRVENGNAWKNCPKRNRFGIWWRPLGFTARVIRFRKLFSRTIFPSQILCLYLEPFTSNRASKLAILES